MRSLPKPITLIQPKISHQKVGASLDFGLKPLECFTSFISCARLSVQPHHGSAMKFSRSASSHIHLLPQIILPRLPLNRVLVGLAVLFVPMLMFQFEQGFTRLCTVRFSRGRRATDFGSCGSGSDSGSRLEPASDTKGRGKHQTTKAIGLCARFKGPSNQVITGPISPRRTYNQSRTDVFKSRQHYLSLNKQCGLFRSSNNLQRMSSKISRPLSVR
jgi:hypothetical protein